VESETMGLLAASSEIDSLDLLASALTPQLRSTLMEGLSDPIMRKIAFFLSQRMRCPVQLLSCVNGVISHDSAISALPDVLLAGIADLTPLRGRIIIAVEGDLIGAMVDAMFGAASSDFVVRHELSNMEVRIGKQMIDLTLSGMAEVLGSFTALNWQVVQYETSVSMLAIADKQDWMISTTGIFETSLGIGSIRAILPYSALEPLEARVNGQTWLIGPAVVDQPWAANMAQLTANTQVILAFDIIRTQVPVGALRRIQVGQILPMAVMQHAVGHVAGRDLLAAEYGQTEGVVCCRPIDACNAGLSQLLAQRPSEMRSKPPRPQMLPVFEDQNSPVPGSISDRILVDLTVRLGDASFTIGSLFDLAVGQLVRLDQAVDDPLAISVGGRPFGFGDVVSTGGGRFGLKILALARPDQLA
jgi:flagellar motor switch protein FliM